MIAISISDFVEIVGETRFSFWCEPLDSVTFGSLSRLAGVGIGFVVDHPSNSRILAFSIEEEEFMASRCKMGIRHCLSSINCQDLPDFTAGSNFPSDIRNAIFQTTVEAISHYHRQRVQAAFRAKPNGQALE
jgi:hypothetical protein